jgi:lipoate-protein ligase A
MMRYQWRLLLDPPQRGHINMQRDLELMEQVSVGESPPTLRIYQWSPAAVSIGYFQDEQEVVDADACRRLGIDMVRRPTGGRAVLHDDELTYSIIVPEAHPFIEGGGVVDAYRSISRGIITAFNLLGITASLTPEAASRPGLSPGSCFDTPSAYEIQVNGKKVVGSAQLRRDGIVLQHGAILFSLQADRYDSILKQNSRKTAGTNCPELSQKAAGLSDLGLKVNRERMTRALVKAFSMVIPAVFCSREYNL